MTMSPAGATHAVGAPLVLGRHCVWPPVVLAPMAGVTDAPFRQLCASFGGGLFVSEMVSARALVRGDDKTWRHYVRFAAGEQRRSLQLYGVDPVDVEGAVARLVDGGHVDHLDLNFGCPAAKITRKGGGAAVAAKPKLLAAIVAAAVHRAGDVPVTLKCRIGLDETVTTFRDTGRVAQEEGCAAITLHGRTAAQHYDGVADWSAIAELKASVTIPVLGNGDIWEATDALAMMAATGCDGVVIGRGCLGRPWLFGDLDMAFSGDVVPSPPRFAAVAAVIRRHLELSASQRVPAAEQATVQAFRKHLSWYVKGYTLGVDVRSRLAQVSSIAEVNGVLDSLDPEATLVPGAARIPRGKTGGRQEVALPDGFLDSRHDNRPPAAPGAADAVSGG